MAENVRRLGNWDFPGADAAFHQAFVTLAEYYSMQFDVEQQGYRFRYGSKEFPYVGALLRSDNHYEVKVSGKVYDVPADGDCAFHALNVLRMHHEMVPCEYIEQSVKRDGVIRLSLAPNADQIQYTIVDMRRRVADNILNNAQFLQAFVLNSD
jgi:hypothetical protein